MRTPGGRIGAGAVLALLVAAHFLLRPRLGDPRFAPDFLLVALLFFAIRVRPMGGTVAGFVLVTALFVFTAAWLRDIVEVLAAHQLVGGALAWQLLAYSPLAALSTATAATITLLLFRRWLRLGAA